MESVSHAQYRQTGNVLPAKFVHPENACIYKQKKNQKHSIVNNAKTMNDLELYQTALRMLLSFTVLVYTQHQTQAVWYTNELEGHQICLRMQKLASVLISTEHKLC